MQEVSEHISLSQLNGLIREAIEMNFIDEIWMVAEIAEMRVAGAGHCYLDLVERKNDKIVARMRANIWKFQYDRIANTFFAATGSSLQKGMKVLFAVSVSFHEQYGVSLVVKNIDPAYSLGDLERKKKEILDRLKREQLIDLNKKLSLPLVVKKIAVITSETAAGWGDFQNQLLNNQHGYHFEVALFPAVMQGDQVTSSINRRLQEIEQGDFDAVIIIRGGGASLDLVGFDTYELGAEVAKLKIPVITGIGHERDETICDLVANTKLKTPTAVAEFLIDRMQSFEEYYLGLQEALVYFSREKISKQKQLIREYSHITKSGTLAAINNRKHWLQKVKSELPYLVKQMVVQERQLQKNRLNIVQKGVQKTINSNQNKLVNYKNTLQNRVESRLYKEKSKLTLVKKTVELVHPKNVLKRGYAMITLDAKVVIDGGTLEKNQLVNIEFRDKKVKAEIK